MHPTGFSRRSLITLSLGCVLAVHASAAARQAAIHPVRRPIHGRYIVRLRENVDAGAFGAMVERLGHGRVRHVYGSAMKGIALEASAPNALALASDPAVALIEEDAVVWASSQVQPLNEDDNWGLDRIDQRVIRGSDASGTAYDHAYRYSAEGSGVNVYVIDSGIRTTHVEFAGRAFLAFDTRPLDPGGDCNGHGTHVAGIAGGTRFGVAKSVTLHAVRVLGCDNTGSLSDLIAGIDWVTAHRVRPAVINMSITAGRSALFDESVRAAIASGITFVAAAANDNADACPNLVGGVPELLVVAASDAEDGRAGFSNYGRCVDLFAPGVGINSAYSASDDSTANLSGTSMSSPHVAGAAALYLQDHPAASPGEVTTAITTGATRALIRDALDTPNRLLFTPQFGDRIPPTISLVAPVPGARVHGRVAVRVRAEDDIEMASVTVRACGREVGRASAPPYAVQWDTETARDGACAIEARARDLAGNVATASLPVVVQNGSQNSEPGLTLAAPNARLWPPNGKLVPVTFEGMVSDAALRTLHFTTRDEYGRVQPAGIIPVVNQRFRVVVFLEARRRGDDRDGRRYDLAVTGTEASGQHVSATAAVVVPHDAASRAAGR